MRLSALLARGNFDASPWGCHLGAIIWDQAGALVMGLNQQEEFLGIYESLLTEAYEELCQREEDRGTERRRWQDGELVRLERCLNLNIG